MSPEDKVLLGHILAKQQELQRASVAGPFYVIVHPAHFPALAMVYDLAVVHAIWMEYGTAAICVGVSP